MNRPILLLFALVLSSPAYGMVYTWTDSAGLTHYTNKDYEIPARYRARTKSLYPEQTDTRAPLSNVQTPPAQPDALSAQQARPDESTQSVIAPEPQKNPQEQSKRRRGRSRGATTED
ncbi:MAG: hypothetical protein WCP20_10000 [Desulfuromonadales bacterium]